MWRDIDPTDRQPDRPGPDTGGRGGGTPGELSPPSDSRDPLLRDLEFPREKACWRARAGSREYRVSESDLRLLAAAGTFRVVPECDLREEAGGTSPRPQRGVERLRDLGLVRTTPYVLGEARTTLVTLTQDGRDVLESHRRPASEKARQGFQVGISKPRELAHDARLYRAYRTAADRLAHRGGRVRRVVLEAELKRDYQVFLQEGNRGRSTSAGKPQRSQREIAEWALSHSLPCRDGHVQFPDARLEYEDREGRQRVEDIEIVTPHYRGAHAAAKASSGFTRFHSSGARVGGSLAGRSGGGRAGSATPGGLAEEVLG